MGMNLDLDLNTLGANIPCNWRVYYYAVHHVDHCHDYS